MNRLPVFTRALTRSWPGYLGWMAAIAATLALYLPLFPSYSGADIQSLVEALPSELVSALGYDRISTGSGYTQATFFGLIGFALLTIAGVSWGTRAIAGDEESGSLELTLAHAVGRVRLVLARAAAGAVRLALLGVFSALVILALNGPSELHLAPDNILAACAALVGLSLVTFSVSLAVGGLTGSRVAALGAGAGIAVAGYVANALANQNPDLDFLQGFSPYYWAYGASPLSDGPDWAGLAALYGLAAALVVVAAVGLRRRDLRS